MTVLVPASVKSLRLRLDAVGNGNVWFDDVQIRKTSNTATTDRKLNITYNAFKSPIQIEETGVDKISFTYNDDNQRSTMYYGGLEDKLLRPLQKHYSADGSMEVKQNMRTGAIEFVTYISGDGYTAPIAVKSDGINPSQYLYLHRDYQGTILAITDANAAIVEKRLFDAWGDIIKVQDGAGNTLNGLTVLDRGYTGHEHLQSVGLINMNARLYDPLIHRFLQVDNYIQDPGNTQNYNQYGYVLNNPLLYTDTSGNKYGDGKDCIDCGPSETQQQIDGGFYRSIASFFQDPNNAEWFKRNAGEVGRFLGRNIGSAAKSVGNFISRNISSIFGNSGPPPNMSSYVEFNNKYYSYTSTHQTGQKGVWKSDLGDQFKLKIYTSLRIGEQKMFDTNDTFFKGNDEGRNYQFNLGRFNLNFRPKDNRVRFMWPSDKYVSNGTSIGMEGIGYHYNIRGKNGKSAGFDAAFRPGGHTLLLVGKIMLSIFQPETIPAIFEESVGESIIIPSLAY